MKTTNPNTTNPNPKLNIKTVKLKGLLAGLSALILAVLVSGCATDNARQAATPAKSGVVCPECRTITLGPVDSSSDWRGGPPTIAQRHECPGCRGVVTLSPGPDGYRHECSVCKQTPYACQVAH